LLCSRLDFRACFACAWVCARRRALFFVGGDSCGLVAGSPVIPAAVLADEEVVAVAAACARGAGQGVSQGAVGWLERGTAGASVGAGRGVDACVLGCGAGLVGGVRGCVWRSAFVRCTGSFEHPGSICQVAEIRGRAGGV
jgi:hypothetical protein